jgi:5'-nucleotidase/UDP-sugar diphosphatase
MSKYFMLFIVFMLAAFAAFAGEGDFTILHFNDLHSHLDPFSPHGSDAEVGGAARLASAINAVRDENAAAGIPTYLLMAGDAITGTTYSIATHGEATFAVLNAMGVYAMVLGNHEFDYGQENMAELIDMAEFPVLSANVVSEGTNPMPPVVPFITFGEDPQLLLIGLTTEETKVTTHPKNVKGLVFENPAEEAKGIIADAGGEADVIIGLTHLGFYTDRKLAEGVPEFDLIVGGHSHTKLETPEYMGDTAIVQAYQYGEYLGRADCRFENGEFEIVHYELIPITAELPDDPTVAEVVAGYQKDLEAEFKKVVATTTVELSYEAGRNQETNFGDLLADVMKEVSGADAAITNGGGMRANIPAGEVTVGDILTALPFSNTIVTLEMSGETLQAALDHCARDEFGGGGFLQVSGLSYTVVPGKGAEDVSVNGAPLDAGKTYKIATNEFVAAGGDGYAMFANIEPYNTGVVLYEAVVSALADGRELPAEPAGRIKVKQ